MKEVEVACASSTGLVLDIGHQDIRVLYSGFFSVAPLAEELPRESLERRNIQAEERNTAPAKQARSKQVWTGTLLNLSSTPT